MPSKLNPYLNFQGNAAEAIEFYRTVFGGDVQIMTFAEGGMPHEPADADKVMHAQLDAENGMTLMAADSVPGTPPASGVSISLSGEDDAELSGYYERLAEGGTVVEPLMMAPWGDKFGMVADRFGILWLVNISGPGAQQGGNGQQGA
jgi:PhnB protein